MHRLLALALVSFCSLFFFNSCSQDAPTDTTDETPSDPPLTSKPASMISVAGGTMTVGAASVKISTFSIEKYEVTYELWTEVRAWGLAHGYTDLPVGRNGFYPVGSNNPVTEVSWYDAVKWCNARSEKDGYAPVYYTEITKGTIYKTGELDVNPDAVDWPATGYRLPTECEWVFAARGGNQTHAYTYSGGNTPADVAWYGIQATHPVGQKSPNELALYDMSGNVWEWCWDYYHEAAYPSGGTTDPRGPSSAQQYRSLRGGSFFNGEGECRIENRYCSSPNLRTSVIGFRCVPGIQANYPPSQPSDPRPVDGGGGIPTSMTLYWTCSDADGDALTYDVYFINSSNPKKIISTNQSAMRIDRNGLVNGTTYYWKVVAKDSKGATTTGPIWSFTTAAAANGAPSAPMSPSPFNAAGGIITDPTLSWSDCRDPDHDSLTYDVYLGTDPDPVTRIAANLRETMFACKGLAKSTTYYWKVAVKDRRGDISTSVVWSFTTGSGSIAQGTVPVAGGTVTINGTPVTISGFNMDKYEVTHELWTEVRIWGIAHGYTDLPEGQNGSSPVGSNNPVTMVTWYDVVKWCNARSEKEGLSPAYYTEITQSTIYRTGQVDINVDAVDWTADGYRLPTECEWEFAARGGNLSHGYGYSGSNWYDDVVWHSLNSGRSTHTVGQKSANELGIYDMCGNVYEWCWDYYHSSLYPAGGTADPKGPVTAQPSRSLRGGSFYDFEIMCKIDLRYLLYYFPDNRYINVGFRCVRE